MTALLTELRTDPLLSGIADKLLTREENVSQESHKVLALHRRRTILVLFS